MFGTGMLLFWCCISGHKKYYLESSSAVHMQL